MTPLQIAESISSRLAQDILCASLNDQIVELNQPITADAAIKLHKWEDAEAKHAFWHTSSHLMAEALQELYPGIQFGIGPAIENGFYYDVMPPEGVVINDTCFATIENKMLELRARKEALQKRSISKADALKDFGDKGQSYKCELISELEDGHITTYTQGNFTDLCRGPHLLSTEPIKAVKVLSCSAAYWRGDEKRPMMTRIYGISFPKKAMLDEYLALLEEAKKRDHRKIGKELELFMFSDMVGKGLPIWLPKGTALRLRLEDFLKRIQKRYGYEQSGELHGLTRVRSFTQDDAHIFCRQDQVKQEFIRVMEIINIIFRALNFENYEAQISLRDPKNTTKYVGSDEVWEHAENAIREACREMRWKAKLLSTVRNSISWSRTPWVAVGSWEPSRWTTTCLSASSWSTPARTTKSIVP